MKTWKMPEPPGPEVDILVDGTGRTFYRCDAQGEYWISDGLGAGRGTFFWPDLLLQRGPVKADG